MCCCETNILVSSLKCRPRKRLRGFVFWESCPPRTIDHVRKGLLWVEIFDEKEDVTNTTQVIRCHCKRRSSMQWADIRLWRFKSTNTGLRPDVAFIRCAWRPGQTDRVFYCPLSERRNYDISIDRARHSFRTGMVGTRKRRDKGEQAGGDHHSPGGVQPAINNRCRNEGNRLPRRCTGSLS